MKVTISTHRAVLGAIAATGGLALLVAHWQGQQIVMKGAHDGRMNPWNGLPGCVFVGANAESLAYWPTASGVQIACQKDALGRTAIVSAVTATPPDMHEVLTHLQPWLAAPPFVGEARGHVLVATARGPLPRGDDVELGLDPLAQANGQAIVACMAGSHADCERAGIDPSRWASMLEGAAFRMAGLIQIDLASGNIEMIASGRSRCFAAFHGGEARAPNCPMLPPQIAARSRRLANHAIHAEAMPGSMVKPVLALALLRALRAEGRELDRNWLNQVLMESDTPKLIDLLLCKDRQFAGDCGRVAYLEAAARDLGYSSGRFGLLLGLGTDVMTANSPRLFRTLEAVAGVTGGKPTLRWTPMSLRQPVNAHLLRLCSDDGWSTCNGERIADLVKEFWGQGDSIATSVGIGNMMLKLGAAANGDTAAHAPHLLRAVRSGAGKLDPAPPKTLAVSQTDAVAILVGLQLTHSPRRAGQQKDGTAFSACLAVFNRATCSRIDWLAGKTGTPVFKHDKFTHQERVSHCADVVRAMRALPARVATRQLASLRSENAHCSMSPYKWYAALVKSGRATDGRWDKVVVALVERNYRGDTIDSQYDKGSPNIAAELVMRYLQASRATAEHPKETHHD
ncbi:hypothetical protein [Massilia glaciei]|nr:hypothetical protein [Massilia glaciei]